MMEAIATLTSQVAVLTARADRAPPSRPGLDSNAPPPSACPRCGGAHWLRQCTLPKPANRPPGKPQPPPPPVPFLSAALFTLESPRCAQAWALRSRTGECWAKAGAWACDSGCSQHMSHGDGEGERRFCSYRQLEPPLKVHFGKVGAHSFALGEGTLTVRGRAGAVSLRRVLYVPDLAGNLFSTRVSVNRGAANLFLPAAHPDGEHRVAIIGDAKVIERPDSITVEGKVMLTATLSEGLYLLDLFPIPLTHMRPLIRCPRPLSQLSLLSLLSLHPRWHSLKPHWCRTL